MRSHLLSALFILATAGQAVAHEWYDPTCCSDKDCAPIPFESVVVTGEGYEVTLLPGDHPLVRTPIKRFFPFGDEDVLPSQDMKYHACVMPGSPSASPGIICFYVVGSGA